MADEVTKTAMGDHLIKFYGARYYRSHQETHLISTTSQRMRQLTKFLVVLRNGDINLRCLTDYLKPCYFDNMVEATKELTGCDPVEKTFRSAAAASKWARILKDLCDAAMFLAIRENSSEHYKEIKTLKQMITSEFKFYVLTNARKDLATKKWEKRIMLPLTDDIIKKNI